MLVSTATGESPLLRPQHPRAERTTPTAPCEFLTLGPKWVSCAMTWGLVYENILY